MTVGFEAWNGAVRRSFCNVRLDPVIIDRFRLKPSVHRIRFLFMTAIRNSAVSARTRP